MRAIELRGTDTLPFVYPLEALETSSNMASSRTAMASPLTAVPSDSVTVTGGPVTRGASSPHFISRGLDWPKAVIGRANRTTSNAAAGLFNVIRVPPRAPTRLTQHNMSPREGVLNRFGDSHRITLPVTPLVKAWRNRPCLQKAQAEGLLYIDSQA